MNIRNTLKNKKVLVAGIAAVAVLGAGGTALAFTMDDDELTGDHYDRAARAALEHVGNGTVTDAERSDDDDPETYEVEVTREDGREVDVRLDENFAVLGALSDDRDADDRTSDDRVLAADEQQRATEAALAAVPGTVTDVDASDDQTSSGTAAYEVDVVAEDGTEWNVRLDRDFAVLGTSRDN